MYELTKVCIPNELRLDHSQQTTYVMMSVSGTDVGWLRHRDFLSMPEEMMSIPAFFER